MGLSHKLKSEEKSMKFKSLRKRGAFGDKESGKDMNIKH